MFSFSSENNQILSDEDSKKLEVCVIVKKVDR